MQSPIDEFCEFIKLTRTEGTSIAYRKGARALLDYCKQSKIQLSQAKPSLLSDLVISLIQRGLQPRTVTLQLRGAERFIKWLRSKGYQIPRFDHAELPKIKESKSFSLTKKSLAAFLIAVDEVCPEPIRTALKLLPLTGLRVNEICTLRQDSLHRREDAGICLVFSGKGSKTRTVPLMDDARRLLRSYRDSFLKDKPGPWMFPSSMGVTGHISIQNMELYCRRIQHKIKVPNLTPHKLRHTFATMLAKKGVSIKVIAKLLGQSSIKTTSIYLHPDEGDLRHAVNILQDLIEEDT